MAGDLQLHGGDEGLRLRLALGGGVLAFVLVLAAALLMEAVHPDPQARHVGLTLLLSLGAGAIGGTLGYRTGGAFARPLEILRDRVGDASGGPIGPLPLEAPGEIGLAARGVAAMANAFILAREELATAASRIHTESQAIHDAATRRSAQSQSEANAINQTNSAALQIAESTRQTLEQADSVIAMGQRSEELGSDGARVVAGAVRATGTLAEHVQRVTSMVAELSERASQIAEIVVTVQDLAEQTDLVALNASVEAAKAGDQGRGFAVVAMEMRQLAEQSRQSANQVRSILAEIDRRAEISAGATEEGAARAQEAQYLARSAGEALEGLIAVIRSSAVAARQISDAARQQMSDVQSMVGSFVQLVRNANAGAEESRALEHSAKMLSRLSQALADRASGARAAPTPDER
jgi:methyl-accepting chemotaxis protein